jgi:TonB family protein
MPVSRFSYAPLFLFATAALSFSCFAEADAAAELCPAVVQRMVPVGVASNAPSATFTYDLQAKTARSIADAAIVADTDDGWYRWNIVDVAMPLGTETVHTSKSSYNHDVSRSAQLSVTFPATLNVRHAWITSARATNEGIIGWEKVGEFACEVPSYETRGPKTPELARAQSHAASPWPSPSPAATAIPAPFGVDAIAVRAAMPFASMDCEEPFHPGGIRDIHQPSFPHSENGNYGTARIAVQIDEVGTIIDASIDSSSGNRAFDSVALDAARKSAYVGAISYCQAVRIEYVFTAEFQ